MSVTHKTTLGKIPYGMAFSIQYLLDSDDNWKKFILNIRDRDGNEVFTSRDVSVLRLQAQQSRSVTETIIQKLTRLNCTVGYLLALLRKAEFFDLVKEITEVHLGETYVPDPKELLESFGEAVQAQEDVIAAAAPVLHAQETQPPPLLPPPRKQRQYPNNANKNVNNLDTKTNEKVFNLGGAVMDDSTTDHTFALNVPGTGHVSLRDTPGSPVSPDTNTCVNTRAPALPPRVSPRPGEYSDSSGPSLPQSNSRRRPPPEPVEDEEPPNIHVTDVETEILTDLRPGKAVEVSYRLLEAVCDSFNPAPAERGGRLIGKGGFAQVFLAVVGSKKLAVKLLNGNTTIDTDQQFKREIDIMSRIVHKNLLPLLAYSTSAMGPYPTLVYPYMCHGSLSDRLKCKNGTEPLSVSQRINIAKGTARAVNHLHTVNPDKANIHRDVKSCNILLDEKFEAQLGDFGLIREGPLGDNDECTNTDIMGSPGYMAPEMALCEITAKVDIYSYGVVLLELLTALPAFDKNRNPSVLTSYIKSGSRESCLKDFLDTKAGEWPMTLVTQIYTTSSQCGECLESRPSMAQLLPEIHNWTTCIPDQ